MIFVLAISFHYTQDILVPFVFAIFIYTVAVPIIKYLQEKFKLPRLLAAFLVFFGFILISAVLFGLIASSLDSFAQGADIYKVKVEEWVVQVEQTLAKHNLIERDGQLKGQLQDLGIFSYLKSVTKTFANFISSFFLVVLFAVFLIMGSSSTAAPNELAVELQGKISKYLVTKFILSISTGLLVWVVLSIAQVELAFMFTLLTVLLNFIPSIGSMVATLLPLPIVLLQYGFGWQFTFVLAFCATIQFVIGNVLEPKIMGKSLDLHPVAILIFLIFWGKIWGIPGMFLAVPITAIIKIILDRIDETKPLANLLAGRMP